MARDMQHDQASDPVEEDFLADGEFASASEVEDARIYRSSSISPSKRRRIEMLQEERELQKALREVFDDD